MGVLPLQFMDGENKGTLGLTGREVYNIEGIANNLKPGHALTVVAKGDNHNEKRFQVLTRLDTPVEVDYYRNGGILQTVLRNLLAP